MKSAILNKKSPLELSRTHIPSAQIASGAGRTPKSGFLLQKSLFGSKTHFGRKSAFLAPKCTFCGNRTFRAPGIAGYLTKDPELRYTGKGTPVCAMTVAMNRKYRVGEETKEEVCFVDASAWNGMGETIAEHFSKGKPILLEGRLRTNEWTTEDGSKRQRLEVVVNDWKFWGKKDE